MSDEKDKKPNLEQIGVVAQAELGLEISKLFASIQSANPLYPVETRESFYPYRSDAVEPAKKYQLSIQLPAGTTVLDIYQYNKKTQDIARGVEGIAHIAIRYNHRSIGVDQGAFSTEEGSLKTETRAQLEYLTPWRLFREEELRSIVNCLIGQAASSAAASINLEPISGDTEESD
jgi:hypothetical protein